MATTSDVGSVRSLVFFSDFAKKRVGFCVLSEEERSDRLRWVSDCCYSRIMRMCFLGAPQEENFLIHSFLYIHISMNTALMPLSPLELLTRMGLGFTGWGLTLLSMKQLSVTNKDRFFFDVAKCLTGFKNVLEIQESIEAIEDWVKIEKKNCTETVFVNQLLAAGLMISLVGLIVAFSEGIVLLKIASVGMMVILGIGKRFHYYRIHGRDKKTKEDLDARVLGHLGKLLEYAKKNLSPDRFDEMRRNNFHTIRNM